MGQQHRVLDGDQLGRHTRLVLEDVEASGEDGPVLQRLDQRLLVDDRAAADIDDDAVRPERLQDLGIDDVVRRGPPGATEISVSTSAAMSTSEG